MKIIYRHFTALWGSAWPVVFLPPLGALLFYLSGEFRSEHAVVLAAAFVFATASRLTRNLLIAVLPGLAIALGYEAIRFLRPAFLSEERIFACEFARIDSALFGFGSGSTPADFFTTHNSVTADLFFALPYTFFWGCVLLYCGILFLVSKGRLRRYLWGLALVHGLAFIIWLMLPVAPPWYVREYGCEIVPNAAPSAAALARLDTYFGITYFEAFYSRTPTVFGAFPSLHVSFPAVAMASGWRWFGPFGKVITLGLTLWMLVASAYLDHHWLIDGAATILLTLMVHAILLRLWPLYSEGSPDAHWPEREAL